MDATSPAAVRIHDRDAIAEALDAITDRELNRLQTAARIWIRSFQLDPTLTEPDDLVSEAVTRTIDGKRGWKVGVDFVHHLITIMRSIAANRRKGDLRRQAAGAAEVRETELDLDEDDDDLPALVPAPEPMADQRLITRQRLATCLRHFLEDSDANAVLKGWVAEQNGRMIRQENALSEKQYRAATLRIRRFAQRGGTDS